MADCQWRLRRASGWPTRQSCATLATASWPVCMGARRKPLATSAATSPTQRQPTVPIPLPMRSWCPSRATACRRTSAPRATAPTWCSAPSALPGTTRSARRAGTASARSAPAARRRRGRSSSECSCSPSWSSRRSSFPSSWRSAASAARCCSHVRSSTWTSTTTRRPCSRLPWACGPSPSGPCRYSACCMACLQRGYRRS
mmetsp:Transcript_4879/g.9964  ORF Transcript_4879/g.9964 Transcript_4879/m.9964 type:complete len:200 (+) Transcript_4879:1627-2226(+)